MIYEYIWPIHGCYARIYIYSYYNRKESKRRVDAGSYIFNCNKLNCWKTLSTNVAFSIGTYLLMWWITFFVQTLKNFKILYSLSVAFRIFSWSFSAIISFNKPFSSWQTCQVFERRVSQSSERHLCSRHRLFVFSRMSFASCAKRSRYPVILSNTDVDWSKSGTI